MMITSTLVPPMGRNTALTILLLALLVISCLAVPAVPAIELSLLTTFNHGSTIGGVAAINAFDPITKKLFVTNTATKSVDVLTMANLPTLSKLASISLTSYNMDPLDIKIPKGGSYFAVSGMNTTYKSDPGTIAFFAIDDYTFLGSEVAGAGPDSMAFTADGKYLIIGNEGELYDPTVASSSNPEGSITIISNITFNPYSAVSRFVRFTQYNGQESVLRAQNIRITPGVQTSYDLEPEFITVYGDKAYVTLQENSAVAVINIPNASIDKLIGLGSKDHSIAGYGLDPSDREVSSSKGLFNISTYSRLFGLYQPDNMESYQPPGYSSPLLVTANEGDARYENVRIKNINLSSSIFPNLVTLQKDAVLGRLEVSSLDGNSPTTNFTNLYSFGARSFSIFDSATGNRIYDSGDEFERKVYAWNNSYHNINNDDNTFDSRSDNRGPEPEGIAIGVIDNATYAFIGFERTGGIMVYDITSPTNVQYVTYFNNRFITTATTVNYANSGDLGPEGITFVSAADSPTSKPLLVVGCETSGTTSIYMITNNRAPTSAPTRPPTRKPTGVPTKQPTGKPTNSPTGKPTSKPTSKPTKIPTPKPTNSPVTNSPTTKPTKLPTNAPSLKPTNAPRKPTSKPTRAPVTFRPTRAPVTLRPTRAPATLKPTRKPVTLRPTRAPATLRPTRKPVTLRPTRAPATLRPTRVPITRKPTGKPVTK